MIPRYDSPEISRLWTEEYKFKTYLKVELAILKAMEGKKVPVGIAQRIEQKAKINPTRIAEIESKVHHDVIAFCSSITENLTPEEGKYFHFGVTSSDIIDTSLTLQIKESLALILEALSEVRQTLFARSMEMKDCVAMGRSHGMYAEPLSFGQKLLNHYAEFSRRHQELQDFYDRELTGQFSGAVGNYTILDPNIEKEALEILDLGVEPVSTQVIPRDRVGKLISLHALLASAIERLAVEIRHLHRSEVSELYEGFTKGQKGSSTMPHKKNPISGENLTGMARVLRSHLSIALENIVLWHERDISHSSTERLYLPDNMGLMFYSLKRLNKTLQNLALQKELIESKVKENFIYLSSYYLHHLIEKTPLTREELYEVVQAGAFHSQSAQEFYQHIVQNLKQKGMVVADLPTPTFDEIKDIYLKHVDQVFQRVQNEYGVL